MLKRFLLAGFVILSFGVLSGAYHKFYVSITQVDINNDSHKLEISSRIFTDDLQATLLEKTGKKLGLGSEKVHPQADSILFNYLVSTLIFKQEGKDLELIYIGKEVEADVTWLYLESKEGILLNKPLEIRNGILHERFPEQKNLVNLRFGKQTSSQIHSRSHPEYSYQIDSI